jgi:hypothetical protein
LPPDVKEIGRQRSYRSPFSSGLFRAFQEVPERDRIVSCLITRREQQRDRPATDQFAQALNHYSEGVEFAQRAILETPSSPTAYRCLVMNLASEGKVELAQRGLRTLRRLLPEISQSWIKQNAVWASHETMKRYAEAFRAAGLK